MSNPLIRKAPGDIRRQGLTLESAHAPPSPTQRPGTPQGGRWREVQSAPLIQNVINGGGTGGRFIISTCAGSTLSVSPATAPTGGFTPQQDVSAVLGLSAGAGAVQSPACQLTSGLVSADVADYTGITDAGYDINIGGANQQIYGLDLSAAASMADVAFAIEDRMADLDVVVSVVWQAGAAFTDNVARFQLDNPSARLHVKAALVYVPDTSDDAVFPTGGAGAWMWTMDAWDRTDDGRLGRSNNIFTNRPAPSSYEAITANDQWRGTVTVPAGDAGVIKQGALYVIAAWEPAPGWNAHPEQLAKLFQACHLRVTHGIVVATGV